MGVGVWDAPVEAGAGFSLAMDSEYDIGATADAEDEPCASGEEGEPKDTVVTLPPVARGEGSQSEGPWVCIAGVSEHEAGGCTGMLAGTASD